MKEDEISKHNNLSNISSADGFFSIAQEALDKSNCTAASYTDRSEIAGWLIYDPTTNALLPIWGIPSVSANSTTMPPPPKLADGHLAAHFHTHPNVNKPNGNTFSILGTKTPGYGGLEPSPADLRMAQIYGAGFIFGSSHRVYGYAP